MNKPVFARNLALVLGDQLDATATVFDDFDPSQDVVWMAEVAEESTHVPSSKQRITLFLSAMRHFAAELATVQRPIWYSRLDEPSNTGTLGGELRRAIAELKPKKLIMTAPGDWRVLKALQFVAQAHGLPLELLDDRHFFSTVRDFASHAKGRKQLRMEFFYREMRKRTGVLMEAGQPVGGQWNFDADNRQSFGKQGPGALPPPTRFEPDTITTEVMDTVRTRFAEHPGGLDRFDWPVTRAQALQALDAFIEHRLPHFGMYQDAMWEGEVWLYHSHLASAMNLKLLGAREVVSAAEAAYQRGHAPLPAVEGFIRQILGWREYVRGVYWTHMPGYIKRNELQAESPLPAFYWTGATDMACMRDALQPTLAHGYAHHIQRLMVTGLYALLAGIHPRAVHEWYLSVYVDAVEWVELPNTLGMSQYADGGVMASKPYVASGKYIDRMSNHCKSCQYRPAQATGDDACPFTTLYWRFLDKHESALKSNPRMAMQLKNLQRLTLEERTAISAQAEVHLASAGAPHKRWLHSVDTNQPDTA